MTDYLTLTSLAMGLVEGRRCPMCEAKSWKSPTVPMLLSLHNTLEPVHAVPVVCGECGYLDLFLCSYLERKAAQLNPNGH